MRRVLVSAGCLFLSSAVSAASFDASGIKYHIDPLLLQAIAQVESGLRPRALNFNADGSTDRGLMQVNSIHLKNLRKQGITAADLLNNPCASIDAGAGILAGFIKQHGYNWKAVGAYNAGSSPENAVLRQQYIARVWREYRVLLRAKQRGTFTPVSRWQCRIPGTRLMTRTAAAPATAIAVLPVQPAAIPVSSLSVTLPATQEVAVSTTDNANKTPDSVAASPADDTQTMVGFDNPLRPGLPWDVPFLVQTSLRDLTRRMNVSVRL